MSALRQLRFDLSTGIPCALRILRTRLGRLATLRVLSRFLWHSLWFRRPKAVLLRSPGARFTWRQLRPVLLLDRSLRAESSCDETMRIALLAEVVAETGAAFIAAQVPINPSDWGLLEDGQRRRLAEASLKLFGNAKARIQALGPRSLSFDVQHCYFVEFCTALKQPELAQLFCHADRRFFGGRADVSLSRASTLANGDDHCAFRFRLPGAEDRP